jgi:hypothetical protein
VLRAVSRDGGSVIVVLGGEPFVEVVGAAEDAAAEAERMCQSSQRSEGGSHLFGKQLGLLPCGEVSASVDLVEVVTLG